jgi:hypothetical protein
MKHVGLISGGFKPFTSGHAFIVELASEENDLVYVFVSKKDRIRDNEFPIYGEQMIQIWETIIKPTLPGNVKIVYSDNPTTDQLSILEDEEKKMLKNKASSFSKSEIVVYTIYTDSEDIKRYDNPRIKNKLLRNMFENSRIVLNPVDRKTKSVDVSGTKARQALSDNDMEKFVSMLPPKVRPKGYMVFNILKSAQKKNP